MPDPSIPEEPIASGSGLTRRKILGAAAALAATPLLATQARAQVVSPPMGQPIGQPIGGPVSGELLSGVDPRPRYLHASVGLPDGRVVVIGGYGVSEATRSRTPSAPTASVQAYDPRSDVWTDLAPMSLPRARHAAVVLSDGRIAVLGGYYVSPLASIEIYDPTSDTWSDSDPLPGPMMDHAVSLCTAGLLVTGGQNGTPGLLLPFPG